MLDKKNGTFSAFPVNHLQQEANEALSLIVVDMLGRKENQGVVFEIADRIISNWAGGSGWKQKVGNTLKRKLPGVLENFVGNSADVDIPALCGRYLKLKWMAANETSGNTSETGTKESADRTRKTIDSFLKNIDLGELDELLLNSQASLIARAGSVSEVLGEHFGKLGTLAPIGVTLVNTLIQSLDHLLDPAINLPPDLTTGLIGTIIQQIDGEALVRVLNKKNELIRMIHIGSLLEGDGNISNLEAALHEKFRSGMEDIDSEAYFKMRVGEISNSSAVDSAKINALKDVPELVRKQISLAPHIQNTKIQMARKKVALLENLDEEECAADITDALSQLDAEAFSDLINQVLERFHDIREKESDIVTRFLTRIATDIDIELLESCSRYVVEDILKSLGPVLSGVAPVILKGLLDLLKPNGEEDQAVDIIELLNGIVSASR